MGYEVLPELRALVPEVLFADAHEAVYEPEETSATKSKAQIKYEELTARLRSSCGNKDAVDKWAEEFCYINDKYLRRRLVRHLQGLVKTSQDRIPYAARLAACMVNKALFTDVGEGLVTNLTEEFSSYLNDQKVSLEARMSNVKFVGELTKFQVYPQDVTIQFITTL